MAITDYLKSIGGFLGGARDYALGIPQYDETAASQRRIGSAQQDLQRILAQGRAKRATVPTFDTSAYDRQMADILAKMNALKYYTPPRITAPNLDLNALSAQARSSVTPEVSAYYQSQLNDFLNRQGVLKQRTQKDYETNVGELEKSLKDYLGQSDITKTRTKEDETTRQLSEGRQFDVGRRGLQDYLGASGLTRSGLGRQQLATAGQERQEVEKVKKVLYTRTFEDLARGEKLKGEATETGKKRVKVDLDRALEDMLFEEKQTRKQVAERQEREIQDRTKSREISLFGDYLSRLTPEQRSAAQEDYGYYFR